MEVLSMKKCIIIIAAITALCAGAYAATFEDFDNSSIVAGKYLDFGSGAAAAGMGNAYLGMANDAGAIFWNPAGLANMQNANKDWNVYFSQNVWFLDSMVSELAIAKNFKKVGVFGLGVSYYNAGKIDKADIDAEGNGILRTETFSPYSLSINGAYSSVLEEGIDYGINFKYLMDVIDGDMAQALSFDIGVRYHFPFLKDLSINVVAKNFGGRLNKNILAKEMSFALAYNIMIEGFKISAGYDVCGKVSNSPVHKFGLEVRLPYLAVLRAGYQMDNTTIEEGFKNFTFGAGINISDKYVDFAFEPYGDLGNAYKVSFGGDF